MRTYLFGASVFCKRILDSGVLSGVKIEGIFDNSSEKWGTRVFDIKVEKPHYSPDIEIIITVKSAYSPEIIAQLLELGYRRFATFIKTSENAYEKKVYDYSQMDYEKDKNNLVLLYLEHRSYSGICALEYMCANELANTYSYRVKIFCNDPNDTYYYYDLVTARYIITERVWNHNLKIRAKTIQLWHGYPLKTMGHMLSKYDEDKYGYLDEFWRKFDYILSYGLNYTTFMSACYGTLMEQYKVTGMPRNDLLFLTDGKKNIEEIFPIGRGKRVVMYMPTFRAVEEGGITVNGSDEGYLFYWKDFNIEQVEGFCKRNNIFFLFKLHPSDASKVSKLRIESESIGILTDDMLGDKCMYEFLNAADVLVTDYSSVYFDYLLLNRPIIFTDNDLESYTENRGLILEPLDFWRPGPVVHTLDKFLKAVKTSLDGEDGYRQAREALLPFVHKYQDGGSTQRLFDLLKAESEK